MPHPFLVAQPGQPHLRRRPVVAEPQPRRREVRRRDRIPCFGTQRQERGVGAIGLRVDRHAAIWRPAPRGRNMTAYENLYWWSNDGLRLHARDYAGQNGPGGEAAWPPILCLPGLTRNARDFDALAARLAGRWRVIALDFRGRAESAYAKDPMSYVPLTYMQGRRRAARGAVDRPVCRDRHLAGRDRRDAPCRQRRLGSRGRC